MTSAVVILAASVCSVLTAGLTPVLAQSTPVKPIRTVVPFPAGGGIDTVIRLLAPKLGGRLGQTIVVDNRSGAGGTLGSEIVAKAVPDGLTLLATFSSHATNATLYRHLKFDTVKDFAPIMLVSRSPQALLINPEVVPARTMKDFLAYARAAKNGAGIDFATAGPGTSSRLSLELFKQVSHLDITAVHYKGGNPAMSDLLGGQVKGVIIQVSLAIPHVKRGKLIALGVSSAKRTPLLPDVPPISEAFPGFEAQGWTGILAPAGTPRAIVNRLNSALASTLTQADVKERLEAQGSEVVGGPPEVFTGWLREESDKWSRIIRDLKITLD